MTYVASGKKLNDSTLQATSSRQLLWDEENRLLAISDNGYVSNYWYDAAGERTVKQSGGSEGVFVNGVFSGGSTKSGKFTAYISPYMVVSNGGNYSKHIYMGSQRIVSKLSNSGIFAANPVTVSQQQARYALQTSKIKERFDSLGVVYNGTAQTGGLMSATPASTASSYFYHPDHLGSSSLITDGTGALTQHIQYVPFGEVFVEERTNSWSTLYKFNGKELDEETGLYYYHARYYDPRLSVWISVDPLAEKYFWTSSYVYCLNNPVKYTDPTGMSPYYDSDGNFLGNDEKGFRGKIFITTKEAFEANSKDGIASSETLQADKNTRSCKDVVLSNEAEAKIYTDVLKQKGFETKKLFNGSVSIWNGKTLNRVPQGYNEPNIVRRFNWLAGKLSVNRGSNQSDLYTVESIVSYLGVHELNGHGIKLYNGTDSHYKAYLDQYKHVTFNTLSLEQQNEIIERIFHYILIYNPELYHDFQKLNPQLFNKYKNIKSK